MSACSAIVYANLKGNLGDFAILHAMLTDIHRKTSDTLVHVYSQPFVPVDERRLEAFRKLAPPFEYMGTMAKDPHPIGPRGVRALRMFSALRLYQERRAKRIARTAEEFGSPFSAYDAVYVAGGAQWTGVNTGPSMFGNLRAIAQHNAEIRSYPVSVSPSLFSTNLRSSLRADFSRIEQPLIARDSATQHALQNIGVNAILGADCVFSLAPSGADGEPTASSGNRLLCVLTKQTPREIEYLVDVARRAGFDPALLTTCEIEDGPVQRSAAERSGIPFIAPATWQDVVAEMNESAIVLTNRLHGLILTSLSSAGILPLMDRSKVAAVVRDAELPLSVNDLSAVTEADLQTARARQSETREKLRAYQQRALKMRWSPIGSTAS